MFWHKGIKINFYFAGSIDLSLRRGIIAEISRAAKRIPPGTFPMRSVDVWVAHWHEPLEGDITGHAYYCNTVTVKLDPNVTFSQIEKKIAYIFYHELHHIARIGTAGFGKTLEDCIITEGLAEAFCVEMGGKTAGFQNNEDLDTVKKFFLTERQERDQRSVWFTGHDPRLPRFAGYRLGYAIVAMYWAITHKKPSQLYAVPTEYILDHPAVQKFLAQ